MKNCKQHFSVFENFEDGNNVRKIRNGDDLEAQRRAFLESSTTAGQNKYIRGIYYKTDGRIARIDNCIERVKAAAAELAQTGGKERFRVIDLESWTVHKARTTTTEMLTRARPPGRQPRTATNTA